MIYLLKKRFLPFIKWLPKLKDKNILKADIIAWITVALVLIPQSMAYARLAWLPVQYWLYASFIPIMLSALFWSSRQLSTWPLSIISLISASAVAPLAWNDIWIFILYSSVLAFLVWFFQILIWLLKMWKLIDFLSHPVIMWFINASVIILILWQLIKIFWLKFWQTLSDWTILEKSEHAYMDIMNVFQAAYTDMNLMAFIIWISSFICLILLKKFFPKLPWILIVVTLFTIISSFIWYEKELWKSFVIWPVPAWLPPFSFPFSSWISLENIKILIPTALTILAIRFAETMSISKSIASSSKKSVSANQELIWQWMANIGSSISTWFVVGWALSRSAINFSAWARTWFSSIVAWIVVAIFLLFLTPLLYHLPQSTLAAIIIFAVMWLLKIKPIIKAWKIEKHDWIIAIITFIVTLISAPHLDKWLIVWIFLSLRFYIYRSMHPPFTEVTMYKDWELRDADLYNLKKSKDVWIYKFEWNIYFANCWYFAWKLMKFIKAKPWIKVVILDIWWVDEIDFSWMEMLEEIVENMHKSWLKVLISKVRSNPMTKFKRSWFINKIWVENIFSTSRYDALDYSKDVLKLDLDTKMFHEYMPLETKKQEIKTYKNMIKKIINKIPS